MKHVKTFNEINESTSNIIKGSKVKYAGKKGKVIEIYPEKVDGETIKTVQIKFEDGTEMPSIPSDSKCHDCNVHAGGFHHPGCDMERCPNCKGQLISCGCFMSDEE